MATRQNSHHPPRPVTRHGIMAYVVGACLMLLALVISGCANQPVSHAGGTSSSDNTMGSSSSDAAAPPVVLRDPAPGTLSVTMFVDMSQDSGDTQNMTTVGLSFSQGDHTVQFAGNERVTCNGADLALKDRAATFQIVHAPTAQVAGTTVQCDYAAGGAVASVSLRIPAPPAITSPLNGERVTRGTQTLLTYRFDQTTGSMMGLVALAVPTSPQPKAIAKLDTPGPLHATLDTSHFAPGPGSIVLTMSLTPQLTTSGASFKSVNSGGNATVSTAVTWV